MYGIMRIEKRGRAAVHGLQMEANRTREDHEKGRDFDRSDIDWNKTQENVHLIHTEKWNEAITKQIKAAGVKERKDSVVMLDGVYTASADFFKDKEEEEIKSFFKDCLDFHVREYCQGDRNRVINAVIHLDETTPHLQVASVPICEDEKGFHLSAKKIMGNRDDYRRRQDRFFDEVTKERGLDRGELIEYIEDEKGLKHRAEDARVHLTKQEFQLATMEERTRELVREHQEAKSKLSQIENEIIQNKDVNLQLQNDLHEAELLLEQTDKKQREAQKARAESEHLAKEAYQKEQEAAQKAQKAQEKLNGIEKSLEDKKSKIEEYNEVVGKLKTKKKELKSVRQQLKDTLDMKARASEIHRIFGDKEVQEYHKNMLESTRAIGSEAYEYLQDAQYALSDVAKRETEVEKKEREIEPLHNAAVADRKAAKLMKENEQGLINNKAAELFDNFLDKNFHPEISGRQKRLEEYCKEIKFNDGKSVLDRFNEQESERANELRKAFEWDR